MRVAIDHLRAWRRSVDGMRPDLAVNLPAPPPAEAGVSLPVHLAGWIRSLITCGQIAPGEHLPATRTLAAQLQFSRGTMVAAYEQLSAEGYVVTARGSGTRVNPQLAAVHQERSSPFTGVYSLSAEAPAYTRPVPAQTPLIPAVSGSEYNRETAAAQRVPTAAAQRAPHQILDLCPGTPDISALATPAWRAAWRKAASHPFAADPDPFGLPVLRTQICEHLRHMRAILTDPASIMITAGVRDGLATTLLGLGQMTTGIKTDGQLGECQDLAGSRAVSLGNKKAGDTTDGRPTLAMESPGYPGLRPVAQLYAGQVLDAPTDSGGLIPARLPKADAVLVTPSHQYPHGGSLSAKRRHELVARARQAGTWLIEDDFDSELRYVGQPLPALHSLEPGRVIVLGTFSALISPQMNVGFAVIPPGLVPAMRDLKRALGPAVGHIPQAALAAFLASGALRRHTQARRRSYARHRDLVQTVLGDLRVARLQPIEGGLHAVLLCERPAQQVVAACLHRGIRVRALSEYWGGAGTENGIVFGFGAHSDQQLFRALKVISQAV